MSFKNCRLNTRLWTLLCFVVTHSGSPCWIFHLDRVGLEDNNKMADGTLATNESLCQYIVDLAKMMGREIATPAEAREILGLKPEWKDRILPQLKEMKIYPGDQWHLANNDEEKKASN